MGWQDERRLIAEWMERGYGLQLLASEDGSTLTLMAKTFCKPDDPEKYLLLWPCGKTTFAGDRGTDRLPESPDADDARRVEEILAGVGGQP